MGESYSHGVAIFRRRKRRGWVVMGKLSRALKVLESFVSVVVLLDCHVTRSGLDCEIHVTPVAAMLLEILKVR